MEVIPVCVSNNLKKAGLKLEDLSFFDVNEAFAVQMLANIKVLGYDPSKVNVWGGSISLGHPTGFTGTRCIINAISQMRQLGGRYALAGSCGGGGLAGCVIVKNE